MWAAPAFQNRRLANPKFQVQAWATCLAYMHMNPVKSGLDEDPKDWRWSSYSFYQGRGAVLIEMNPVE